MCGRLRYGTDPNSSVKVGNPIPIILAESGISKKAIWAGFATKERLSWWKSAGAARPVLVKVDSFLEGKTECKVQSGHFVGIILGKDIVVSGKTIGKAGSVKILTRQALTPFEQAIHPRWPIAPLLGSKEIQLWTYQDVISK